MNATSINRETDKIAENAYLKLVSRVSMVIASAAGIPFALFMLAQTYGKLNALTEFQIETKLIVQQLQANQQNEQSERRAIGERVRNLEETTRQLERAQAEILEILRASGNRAPASPRQ